MTRDAEHTPSPQSVVPMRGPGHCDDDAAWAEFVRQYDGQPRSRPDMTDFALANRVFMADRNDLDLIVWQTAAKERIRWLSIELAKAQAALSAAPAMKSLRFIANMERNTDRLGSVMVANWIIQDLAALSPEAPARDGAETGWLIEGYDSKRGAFKAQWWGLHADLDEDGQGWTTDSLKALRFSREADAQAYIDNVGWTEAKPTDHQWSDTSALTPRHEAPSSAVDDLVDRFAVALKEKLRAAEAKYGHDDAWLRDDWRDDLIRQLGEHVQKGDPRDVAAYCAFAWHHEWSVGSFSVSGENDEAPAEGAGEALGAAWRWFQEWAVRLEQAERQRDELRKALEDHDQTAAECRIDGASPQRDTTAPCELCGATQRESCGRKGSAAYAFISSARTLLANQGADQ